MFRQLTISQRQTIASMLREGASQAAIAREIGVHRSTVKREIERNSMEGNYQPEPAHQLAINRKYVAGQLADLFGRRGVGQKKKKIKYNAYRRRSRIRTQRGRVRSLQFYSKRPDRRSWWLHQNKFRSWLYGSWKKWHDRWFRLRIYSKEEAGRTVRVRWRGFVSQLSIPLPVWLKRGNRVKLCGKLAARVNKPKNEKGVEVNATNALQSSAAPDCFVLGIVFFCWVYVKEVERRHAYGRRGFPPPV